MTDELPDGAPDHRTYPTADGPEGRRNRIGLFGGTFDPIHIGHLILAEEAWSLLDLDAVYLVPAGDPPHKTNQVIASVEDRIRMAELATRDVKYIRISRVDADRPGPHYTADMVRLVAAQANHDTDLFFLMGMDSLQDLPSWSEASWLVANCTLVALSRHDVEPDWQRLSESLPGIRERVIILDMPELEISSRALRERIKAGKPIRYQVPRAVECYIREHDLYS